MTVFVVSVRRSVTPVSHNLVETGFGLFIYGPVASLAFGVGRQLASTDFNRITFDVTPSP